MAHIPLLRPRYRRRILHRFAFRPRHCVGALLPCPYFCQASFPPSPASLKRADRSSYGVHRVHACALQDEFRFDPVKEAEWEPFPSEWVEVDRIIAKRVRDPQEAMAMGLAPNQLEYLVKWKSMTYDGVSAPVAGRAGSSRRHAGDPGRAPIAATPPMAFPWRLFCACQAVF